MSWDLELVTACFGGVEFEVEKTSDPLMRRWAEHKYPYKDGADIEDMGREPRRTTMAAVIIGESATTTLAKLMHVIDAGETKTFDHPLLGSWQAKLRAPGIDAVHSFRDGYRVELEAVEDGTATELPVVFSIVSLETVVAAGVSAVSAAAAAVKAAGKAWDAAVKKVNDAIAAVNDFVAKAKSYKAKVEGALNKVRSTIKAAKRAIDKAVAFPAQVYGLTSSLMKVGSDCEKLARSVTSSLPRLQKSVVQGQTSTRQIAQRLFRDGSRVTDIEAANTIRNPAMIPPGMALKVPKK